MENLKQSLDQAGIEFETFPVKVSFAGETVIADYKTKIEHDRIVGIVCLDTYAVDSPKGLVQIEVETQKIIAQDKIHKFLMQKTASLSVDEAAKKVNVPINTSDVRILFTDQNTSVPSGGYYVYFYFLVTKRKA